MSFLSDLLCLPCWHLQQQPYSYTAHCTMVGQLHVPKITSYALLYSHLCVSSVGSTSSSHCMSSQPVFSNQKLPQCPRILHDCSFGHQDQRAKRNRLIKTCRGSAQPCAHRLCLQMRKHCCPNPECTDMAAIWPDRHRGCTGPRCPVNHCNLSGNSAQASCVVT